MAEIIDARVKQKTGTAAEFAGYTLLEGEIALVRTSASGPVWNFKVGPGNFDSLDWSLQNPGAAQKADTSTVFPAGVPGLYIPTESGTYDGVSVDLNAGYTQLIWDGANLVDVVFPIDLSGYAKKQDVAPLVWGVGDEHDNVALWLDGNLELHTKLAKGSWPPPRIPTTPADLLDFGISDPVGNIIFGILKDGEIYPPQKVSTEEGNAGALSIKRAEHRTMPTDVSRDGIWNQWIEPIAAHDSEGNIWFCSIGTDSNIYVNKKTPYGAIQRRKLGVILSNLGEYKSDDHNCPAVLIDDRPGADYPIMLFQVDHNTTPMRYWRFDSLDMATWDVDDYTTIGSQNYAYSQPHRNGDEIFIFCRYPSLPRPWDVIYSSDNGDTWQQRRIFTAAAEWLYMLTKDAEDGSGIHIMCYGHPQNSSDQNIYYLWFDYSTGQVINPAAGVVIADLRAAIANPSFIPVDAFAVGLMVYEATGPEITRFWDYREGEDNTITVLLTSQTNPSTTKSGYETSRYRVVNFSRADGDVNYNEELGRSGYAIDGLTYWAGGCLVSATKAVLCEWTPNSVLNGGSGITDNIGLTEIRTSDFTDVGDIVTEIIMESDLKVIRPYITKNKRSILFCECEYFNTYDDFYASVLVNEIDNLNI